MSDMLALMELVLSIVSNARSKDEAYEKLFELYDDIRTGAWEEVLSKIRS